jgi:hypothetical protein
VLTDCDGAESIRRGAPVNGEIRTGHRNYVQVGTLHELRQQRATKPTSSCA